MNFDKNLFYTLDEVKELIFKTGDQNFFKEENIVNLIHTDRLTPYIRYKGLVDIVTEVERASDESINQTIDSLYHTINTQMCNLEIGEAIHPHDYDSNANLGDTKYFIGKLLFLLNAKRALKTLGITRLADGIFRLLPLSITYLGGNIEAELGPKMFIPKIIDIKFSDDGLKINENILGYTLYPTSKDDYELIFSKDDLQYIVTVIERSHELPKIRESLADTNRIIAQKNIEIKKLKKELEELKSTSPTNDIKDSAYLLIYVLKELLLDPNLNAFNFKSNSLKSTGEPTQSGLISYIGDMRVKNLGKRNIEDIFSKANKTHNK